MTDSVEHRVSCSVANGIADVRLNRPEKLNALDGPMFDALISTARELREDDRVRAVVLSGNGNGFCAGLDFASFQAMTDAGGTPPVTAGADPDGPAQAAGQQAAHGWAQLPVPVIAALHGVALGGGLQVALGADIRLVAPGAQLSVMEIRWGLIPDMTGTQLLPELVGRDVAKELTFTGRVVDGTEAARLRLATRAEDDPRAAALALAAEIAGKSPHAVRRAKTLLDTGGRVELAEGFAAEQRAIRELIGSPNQIEAVQANMDKRAPEFADTTAHDR